MYFLHRRADTALNNTQRNTAKRKKKKLEEGKIVKQKVIETRNSITFFMAVSMFLCCEKKK